MQTTIYPLHQINLNYYYRSFHITLEVLIIFKAHYHPSNCSNISNLLFLNLNLQMGWCCLDFYIHYFINYSFFEDLILSIPSHDHTFTLNVYIENNFHIFIYLINNFLNDHLSEIKGIIYYKYYMVIYFINNLFHDLMHIYTFILIIHKICIQ